MSLRCEEILPCYTGKAVYGFNGTQATAGRAARQTRSRRRLGASHYGANGTQTGWNVWQGRVTVSFLPVTSSLSCDGSSASSRMLKPPCPWSNSKSNGQVTTHRSGQSTCRAITSNSWRRKHLQLYSTSQTLHWTQQPARYGSAWDYGKIHAIFPFEKTAYIGCVHILPRAGRSESILCMTEDPRSRRRGIRIGMIRGSCVYAAACSLSVRVLVVLLVLNHGC